MRRPEEALEGVVTKRGTGYFSRVRKSKRTHKGESEPESVAR